MHAFPKIVHVTVHELKSQQRKTMCELLHAAGDDPATDSGSDRGSTAWKQSTSWNASPNANHSSF